MSIQTNKVIHINNEHIFGATTLKDITLPEKNKLTANVIDNFAFMINIKLFYNKIVAHAGLKTSRSNPLRNRTGTFSVCHMTSSHDLIEPLLVRVTRLKRAT